MRVRLIGANPFVTLYSGEKAVVYASVWRVDWSDVGAGNALVYGDDEQTRVVCPRPELGRWLAESFNRYFDDVCAGLPWHRPDVTLAPVEFELDLAVGFRAAAADVEVELGDILTRRLARDEDYRLGDVSNVLSTVWMPCGRGSITVAGVPVAGDLKMVEDPIYSSAAIADAEVWCGPAVTG